RNFVAGRCSCSYVRRLPGEELERVTRRGGTEFLRIFAACCRDGAQHVRQVHGFVAARLRLWMQVSRQKVWPIGFDEQTLARNVSDDFLEVLAAALIANPAC